MVENSLSVAGFCLCSALLAVLLRQYCREQSMLTALGACAAVMTAAAGFLAPVLEEVRDIFSGAGIPDSYMSLIFKAAAICFLTQMTCDICTDSGESAIATAAEMWGRGALAVMSLPMVRSLLERIEQLLE